MSGRSWTLGDVFVLRHAGFPFDWLESLGVGGALKAEVDRLLDGGAAAPARADVEAAYEAERQRLRLRLRELARQPLVKEAVFLSSPDMFENVWARHVDEPPTTDNSDSRRVERQLYAYLQRLCAKNETTSFFGPMGHGETQGDDDVVEVRPASTRRRTFIAYWAVEALASRIAGEREIWRALPLRRSPLFAIDAAAGAARCEPLDRVVPLSADQLRLLAAVARCEQAPALAVELGESLAFVEEVALSLLAAGVLVRRLWFRSDEADTLGNLRAALDALPVSAARARWRGALAGLEALRARFEGAALEERRRLLPEMEALFATLAQVPARRAGGRLYTDRLILNEEASSPFGLRLGRAAADKLAAALSPLLESCAAHGEALQRRAIEAIHAQLPAGESMPFLRYATRLRALTVTAPPLPDLPDARPPVAQLPARACGTSSRGSRFALPDVCLGRRADGSLHPVLARMHHHLLTRGWLFTFHPDPARVDEVAASWLRREKTPLTELASGRHNKGFYSFPGRRLANAAAELLERGHAVDVAADLEVTWDGATPRLRAADGTPLRLYLPLADLTLHPPFTALAHPPVVKPTLPGDAGHTPRLDCGAATFQRESWELSSAGWSKLTGFALFVEVQRQRRRLALPRFTFARVPSERKPFLVDSDCPFSIELLRHHARGGLVRFEEMLPGPDELWLRDERGRYTFELRMQAQREDDEDEAPPSSEAPPDRPGAARR